MKTLCKTSAVALALVTLHLSPFAFRLHAAVPTEWQVRIGPKATVYQAERYHGDALALRATLTSGGMPLVYQGAARLYAQTNGMGALWWDLAPVTVASNVLAATWRPEFDTGADVVDVFLGAPSNFQAHARIRFLPSPGPAPNSLPMPTPVLDFAAVDLVNVAALTNGWIFGSSFDLAVATNYTNQVAEEFEDGTRTVQEAEVAGEAAFATSAGSADYANATDGLIGFGVTYNWEDLFRQSTNAAVAVADAKISTNNAAFVSAVLAAPLVGADASDLTELSDYGSYGTVGAALLALIAGLAALKRRVGAAETALTQKASKTDLPYAMVTLTPGPDLWSFGGNVQSGVTYSVSIESDGSGGYNYTLLGNGNYLDQTNRSTDAETEIEFATGITATRPSTNAAALLERANNLVTVTANTTLTLPPFVAGKVRDLLVACTIGLDGNDEPWSVIFQGGDGEEISFKAEGDDAASATFPVPDEAGEWWYSFTERAPHTFAVSLKQLQSVLQPTQTQGGGS